MAAGSAGGLPDWPGDPRSGPPDALARPASSATSCGSPAPTPPPTCRARSARTSAGLAVGATTWSFVLQPTGKVDAWVRVTRPADDEFVLDIDVGAGEALVARLRRFLLRTKADIDAADAGRWSPCGARAAEAARRPGRRRPPLAVPAGWPGARAPTCSGPTCAVARRRRPRSAPDAYEVAAHPVGRAGHGPRAHREDDPGRGRPVGHRRLGQLHQGLLHRPGAGGPHRQPGRQRAPPPAGAGRPAGGLRRVGADADRRRRARSARSPRSRPTRRAATWAWRTWAGRSPRRPRLEVAPGGRVDRR